jgi:hypothetical protein
MRLTEMERVIEHAYRLGFNLIKIAHHHESLEIEGTLLFTGFDLIKNRWLPIHYAFSYVIEYLSDSTPHLFA